MHEVLRGLRVVLRGFHDLLGVSIFELAIFWVRHVEVKTTLHLHLNTYFCSMWFVTLFLAD